MSQDAIESSTPPAAEPKRAPDVDLSPEIVRTIAREKLDRVRCIRVFGNYYRCNWWAPMANAVDRSDAPHFGVLSTHHVRKSRFLNVTSESGQLIIKEL